MKRWLARERDLDSLERRMQVLEYQFGSLLHHLGYVQDGNVVKPESAPGSLHALALRHELQRAWASVNGVESRVRRLESDVDTRIGQLDGSIRTLGAMIGHRHKSTTAPAPKKRKAKKHAST